MNRYSPYNDFYNRKYEDTYADRYRQHRDTYDSIKSKKDWKDGQAKPAAEMCTME